MRRCGCASRWRAPDLSGDYVCEVCWMTSDDRAHHFCAEDVMRRDGGEIAIEHDEVSHHAGRQRSFVGLTEFCVSRALRVGVERLRDGQLLFRKVALGASFVLSCHGGVDAAEGSDGLDWIVSAEGERHTVIEEALPRIGVARTIVTEALLRPRHVGEEMVGLHGGDDAELLVAVEVGRVEDLRVLDTRAWDTRCRICRCGFACDR